MFRYIAPLILVLFLNQFISAQNVSATHDIQPGTAPNEYTIKTTITGLEGVDIARIKYLIDNTNTYEASPNNSFFSDRNEKYIKFYIMAVPPSGVINVELGLVLGGNGEYAFPVELQYSRNEEKETVNLPQINLSGGEVLATVETPEAAPEVEEMPSETPTEVEAPEPDPVVEVIPEVEETPEIAPEVEETPSETPTEVETPEPEPVVEVVPEAEEIPEIAPEVEETPEPAPVVEKTPAPEAEETPEVAPDVEEIPEPAPIVEETPEPVAEETPELPAPAETAKTSGKKYTVQILSLSEFSQSRLDFYIKQHHLTASKVNKHKEGPWMKITYGDAKSATEAMEIKEKLQSENNIVDAFIVRVK